MKLPRRKFLNLVAGAVALPAVSQIARAQTYPTRQVRIIVTLAAGGGNDIIARLIGQWLSERLGKPFIIEDRPGAGGNIGTEVVARAAPDGYTLLLVAAANAINMTLYKNLNFNFIRDIAPVAYIMRVPYVMVVNPLVPASTVPEFIAYAKANPGKINYASSGIGTPPHVSSELFKMMTGVNIVHVPYRGAAPAITDLLGGQVQVMFATTTASFEYIRAGIKRVAIMFSPETAPYVSSYFQPSFEAAARLVQVEPIIAPVHSDAEIEMVITSLAREPEGGLITVPDNFVNTHRQTIISLAARNKIPAVYQISAFVRDGGLLSYGVDDVDAYRRAATVADRILRGEKPSDLPVQSPGKFEMAVNLKAAKALGLTIPETLLATADEVIQ